MIKQELHVVTGGGGYPGFHLGKKLAEEGHSVRLLDIREPVWDLEDGMEFQKCNICDMENVCDVLEGADVVYHMASYGMSGREMLNKEMIERVNIGGTANILDACLQLNITRFVYTSTYNVIFYGEAIHNGDETLPYVPEGKFTDHYSMTKMRAERNVIFYNERKTADGSLLRTCALRMAGIYGPGEQRHFPRIVDMLEGGLILFKLGADETRVDFLHVDNLVQAHVKAAKALTPENGFVSAGKAYFINDNAPVNNNELLRPLIEGLGYTYPSFCVPTLPIFYFAWLTELIHYLISPFYNFQPFLTRTEVYKTCVTHYFSIENARKDFGYSPTIQNDLSGIVTYYRKLGRVKGHKSSAIVYYLVSLIIIALIYYAIMYFLPQVTTTTHSIPVSD